MAAAPLCIIINILTIDIACKLNISLGILILECIAIFYDPRNPLKAKLIASDNLVLP